MEAFRPESSASRKCEESIYRTGRFDSLVDVFNEKVAISTARMMIRFA